MAYGPEDVSRDLMLIRDGTAQFEERARLEHHLLTLLKTQGTAAVGALLQSFADHDFRRNDDGASEPDAKFVSGGSGFPRVSVATYLGPHSVSVNVTVEEVPSDIPELDPRHRAFYDVWESLLGISDRTVSELDPKRKAVFLIGLLEAEVMNGGLGQYFANTEGTYLEATIQCLERIGAVKTGAIVMEAAKLKAGAKSYLAAWDSKPRDFESLDDRFLESGEDLAGLTADVFLMGTRTRPPSNP